MGRSAAAAPAAALTHLVDLVVEGRPLDVVLASTVEAALDVDAVSGAAVLLPGPGGLEVAAAGGRPFTRAELDAVTGASARPVPVGVVPTAPDRPRVIALAVAGRPVGMLLVRGVPPHRDGRDTLTALARHAALAVEQARLRQEALRAEVLEQTDRLRQALLAAVAHDVRGPLASMKVASSSLRDTHAAMAPSAREELYELLDCQIDHLSRLASGLLDAARCRDGSLAVHPEAHSVHDLARTAVAVTARGWEPGRVHLDLPELPPVNADPLLVGQVLVNLLDNANRYGPPGTPITVAARAAGPLVEVSVADAGPGMTAEQRQAAFDPYRGDGGGGRAGLGLAIARSFVEAHGQRIWVDEAAGEGARLVFTLAAAT